MDDFGLLVAQYNSSLPTLSDGQLTELQVDSSGRLLVQADVSVVIDFLGLNGASDSSNILVVGTEDGTDTGTAHALRLAANGAVIIDDGGSAITVDGTVAATQSGTWNIGTVTSITNDVNIADGGNSITVDAVDLDIRDLDSTQDSVAAWLSDGSGNALSSTTGALDVNIDNASIDVTATDLDIRNLTASQDSVAISDGTDTLAVNADGSINVNATSAALGTEQYTVTDSLAAAGDGLETITATATPWVTVASLSVGAGTTAYVYGYQWACDQNAQVRLVTDDTTDTVLYKTDINSSAAPGTSEHWGEGGRIEIPGAADLEVRLQIKKRSATGGNANGTGSIHVRTA